MLRTPKLLGTAGLVTLALTLFGANAASAEQDPSAQSPRVSGTSSEDVPVVHDPALSAGLRADSSPELLACYDDQTNWDAGLDDPGGANYLPGADDFPDSTVGRVPVYVAESDCNDVNLRITGGWSEDLQARTCYFPTSGPYYCNDWVPITPGDTGWYLIATNVIDGTRFEVELSEPSGWLTGAIAY